MNKIIALLVIGIILVIAAITNPDADEHREKIKQMLVENTGITDSLIDGMESDNSWESAGSALGYALGMAFIDKILDNALYIDNYVFFSISKVKIEGEERKVAIGLFGNFIPLRDFEKGDLEY